MDSNGQNSAYDNLLSYDNILHNIRQFSQSGGHTSHEFNILDTPAQKYFKILFYFDNASKEDNVDPTKNNAITSSGLLAPTWLYTKLDENNYYSFAFENAGTDDDISDTKMSKTVGKNINAVDYSHLNWYNYNSAWSFLMLNDEKERADKLQKFITLLSDINTYSPWYFSSVSGIQDALDRKMTEEDKFDMNERKKLTIKCLPDAFDNRIDTLLSLYRDVTWSWRHKKEIIPSNLRKFDMAIYIFEAPNEMWHTTASETIKPRIVFDKQNPKKYKEEEIGRAVISDDEYFKLDAGANPLFNAFNANNNRKNNTKYLTSFKMIEFHDCEFNYNSAKTAWEDIDNQNGIQPEYSIEIFYNDCYEYSYNDIMSRLIGDFIITDLIEYSLKNTGDAASGAFSSQQYGESKQQEYLKKRLSYYDFVKDNVEYTSANQAAIARAKSLSGHTYGTLGNLSLNEKRTGDAEVKYKAIPKQGFLTNAVGQIVSDFTTDIKSKVNKYLLGNIFSLSLTGAWRATKEILKGNLASGTASLKKYIDQGGFYSSKDNYYDGHEHSTYIGKLWDQWVETPLGLEEPPFKDKFTEFDIFTKDYWTYRPPKEQNNKQTKDDLTTQNIGETGEGYSEKVFTEAERKELDDAAKISLTYGNVTVDQWRQQGRDKMKDYNKNTGDPLNNGKREDTNLFDSYEYYKKDKIATNIPGEDYDSLNTGTRKDTNLFDSYEYYKNPKEVVDNATNVPGKNYDSLNTTTPKDTNIFDSYEYYKKDKIATNIPGEDYDSLNTTAPKDENLFDSYEYHFYKVENPRDSIPGNFEELIDILHRDEFNISLPGDPLNTSEYVNEYGDGLKDTNIFDSYEYYKNDKIATNVPGENYNPLNTGTSKDENLFDSYEYYKNDKIATNVPREDYDSLNTTDPKDTNLFDSYEYYKDKNENNKFSHKFDNVVIVPGEDYDSLNTTDPKDTNLFDETEYYKDQQERAKNTNDE